MDATDLSELTVLRDRAETFRLGTLPPPGWNENPIGSRFWSTCRLLGENCADFNSVGVLFREAGNRGGAMKPYRSTSAPSTSSQSSKPPASSCSRRTFSGEWEKELVDLGPAEACPRFASRALDISQKKKKNHPVSENQSIKNLSAAKGALKSSKGRRRKKHTGHGSPPLQEPQEWAPDAHKRRTWRRLPNSWRRLFHREISPFEILFRYRGKGHVCREEIGDDC